MCAILKRCLCYCLCKCRQQEPYEVAATTINTVDDWNSTKSSNWRELRERQLESISESPDLPLSRMRVVGEQTLIYENKQKLVKIQ